MWAGGHYVWHAEIDGWNISRKMTPISPVNEKGKAVFVVKIYRPCEEYPQGGKFTSWLEKNVNVGDSITCEGPIGRLSYLGPGNIKLRKKQLLPKKRVVLICGGSGITPHYSLALTSTLSQDGLEVWLLFSNKTKDDILCK